MTTITAHEPESSREALVLVVVGDLDVAGAWDLRQRVNLLAAEDGIKQFDVDLTGVGFVDSSGLGQLARYWAAAGGDGVGLTLTAASDGFWSLARATGRRHHFDQVLPVLAS